MTHSGWPGGPNDPAGGATPPAGGKRPAPWAVPTPTAPPVPGPAAVPGPPPEPGRAQGPGPGVAPGPGRSRRLLAVAAVLLLLVVGGGIGAWFVLRDSGSDQDTAADAPSYGAPLSSSPRSDEEPGGSAGRSTTEEPSASSTSAPPSSSAPTSPTAMTEEQALAELQAMRAASLSTLVLDGRWVAQVASKSVGITDPLQVAANGTNTFYAVDILAESRVARQAAADPSSALVLQSLDFGKRSVARDGQPYWVTLVDDGFASSEEVDLWCARAFPSLTPEQLANACAARTLAPPHD